MIPSGCASRQASAKMVAIDRDVELSVARLESTCSRCGIGGTLHHYSIINMIDLL
ncbi:hypothetical protein [Frankia sp. B2]|uniref:hypothetical protein n=1 Tax=Frankia sp. B2 TaxID=2541730 RepID=UPI001F10203E|nr:hypothetical protein [Frankia sp. B2]